MPAREPRGASAAECGFCKQSGGRFIAALKPDAHGVGAMPKFRMRDKIDAVLAIAPDVKQGQGT